MKTFTILTLENGQCVNNLVHTNYSKACRGFLRAIKTLLGISENEIRILPNVTEEIPGTDFREFYIMK